MRSVIPLPEDAPQVRPSARVKRIAELLDLDHSQVRRMVEAGQLEAHRVGKRGIRIYLDSVEHWQETHPVTPRTTAVSTAPPVVQRMSPATRAAHRQAIASLRRAGLL